MLYDWEVLHLPIIRCIIDFSEETNQWQQSLQL